MNISVICGAAIVTACAYALIKELRPHLAPVCAAAGVTVILGYIIISAVPIIDFLKQMDALASGGISVMLKGLGICVFCQLTADICRECGQNAVASKVVLAGKLGILLLALPLIRDIVKIAGELSN